MGHLTVHNLDDEVIARLSARAAANGRSLEAEHRALLEEALGADAASFAEAAARLRAELAGRPHSDSAELIRGDRDRDHTTSHSGSP